MKDSVVRKPPGSDTKIHLFEIPFLWLKRFPVSKSVICCFVADRHACLSIGNSRFWKASEISVIRLLSNA